MVDALLEYASYVMKEPMMKYAEHNKCPRQKKLKLKASNLKLTAYNTTNICAGK